MKEKLHKRLCPRCKREIFHTQKNNRDNANKLKKLCVSCGVTLNHSNVSGCNNPFYGKTHSKKTKLSWKKNRDYSYMYIKNPMKQIKTKKYISKLFTGKGNPMYGKYGKLNHFFGKHHTKKTKNLLRLYTERNKEEMRKKFRIAALKRIENLKSGCVSFNPMACEYFDKLNKQKSWNLQHALNGGEVKIIGYSLDAYDKQRNIIVEYDESYHNRPNQIKKDLIRQNNLLQFLNCKFYRYNTTTKKLKRYYLPTSPKNFSFASP